MKNHILFGFLLLLSLPCVAAPPPLPTPVLPGGLGVNIHFTDPRPGEMEMLAAGGFRWVRMDFSWAGTEKEKGQYDFTAFDRLMAALEPHRIRALFILDYANALYDNGLSPHTDEGRAAFARWAAAAAVHFKGRGILWEMYNEPNISFWKPTPNADDYAKLALAVGEALQKAAPGEVYIGPATSTIDLKFLETCFKAGLLRYWKAVSVHPYRQNNPETATEELRKLRSLIAKYAPPGKTIPIFSGEWGYSSGWDGQSEEKQGIMLPRQWLANQMNEVPLSIWYDWHDDGLDPKEPEHHFGTVFNPYHQGQTPVYDPKPAYQAAKALTQTLGGFVYNKRLFVGSPDDYVLLFSKGADVRLAVWTTAHDKHPIHIAASPGRFGMTGHLGQVLPPVSANALGLEVQGGNEPVYLTPDKPNDLLRVAAAFERAPLELNIAGPDKVKTTLRLTNPLTVPIRVDATPPVLLAPGARGKASTVVYATRSEQPVQVLYSFVISRAGQRGAVLGRVAQETTLRVTNPLRVVVLPRAGNDLPVRLENPSGEAFAGNLTLTGLQGVRAVASLIKVTLNGGEMEKTFRFRLAGVPAAEYGAGAHLTDNRGQTVLDVPTARFRAVDDWSRFPIGALPGYSVVPDGDLAIPSTQTLSIAAAPAGDPSAPTTGNVLRLDYDFDPGWKFARVLPGQAMQVIEGQPKAFGLWVYGDGEGNLLRLRFVDATGQTFQPNGGSMTWKGWRYVTFAMDGKDAGVWGGAKDGIVHGPIHWDSLLLLDSAVRKKTGGTIYLSGPTLIY